VAAPHRAVDENELTLPISHAIVLGIVQGLAEFLPISSSGHLILVPWLLGWNDFAGNQALEKAFDTALHIGTVVAVIGYFWSDLWGLLRAWFKSIAARAVRTPEERMAWLLVLSAIPGIITGALLDDFITEHLGAEWLIGLMLVVFGIVLYIADQLPSRRTDAEFEPVDAAQMGVAQAVALQPGVSRSGVTISMARRNGFNRDAATRLSFLMATPITAGAALYKMAKLQSDGGIPSGFGGAFAVGILVSGVVGFLAIAFLLKLVRTGTFTPFVVYRVVFGTFVIIVAATGLR
jgi:undecaprenyl-diphosphatase